MKALFCLTTVLLAGAFMAACSESEAPEANSTAVRATPAAVRGFVPDPTMNAALSLDVIELARLTGYQQVACEPGASGGYAPPACRPNKEAGTEVEILPVYNCYIHWVRPEDVPSQYQESLGESPVLQAVYEPNPTASSFGADYVAVVRTSPEDADAEGVAVFVREGRVVALEHDCGNFDAFYAERRIASFILEPQTAQDVDDTPAP